MGDLETKIGKLRLTSPLIAMSGIFAIEHFHLLRDLKGFGAIVTKSVTLEPRLGNPEPRIIETPAGLLNSIGLHNPGVKKFIYEQLPKLRVLNVPIIASVAGAKIEEYIECSYLLASQDEVEAIELNVSCPNIREGGMEFGCNAVVLNRLVNKVRKKVRGKTLIVKLTPNVTDIALQAQAAVDGGADVISLINTLRGMAIDLNTRKPKLGNKIGGLSGQGIHPVAVYMVYRCYTACCRKNNIPIIGIGGITCGEEALELILAGATCIGIGTALFRDLNIFENIEKFLSEYMDKNEISNINELIGQAANQ